MNECFDDFVMHVDVMCVINFNPFEADVKRMNIELTLSPLLLKHGFR